MMLDQNRLIEDEIDRVIKDDDAIARTLENRRSTSPIKGRGVDSADKNLRVAQRYNQPNQSTETEIHHSLRKKSNEPRIAIDDVDSNNFGQSRRSQQQPTLHNLAQSAQH